MLNTLLTLSGLKKDWPLFSEEEIRMHNTRRSLWIVSDTSVYDVTAVLGSHPGGEAAILRRGGGAKNCEGDYTFHSRYARREWDERKVGEITPEVAAKLFSLRTRGCAGDVGGGSPTAEASTPGPGISRTHGALYGENRTRTVDTYASTTVTPNRQYRQADYELYLPQVH